MRIFFDKTDKKESFRTICDGIGETLLKIGFKPAEGRTRWSRWNGWRRDDVFFSRGKYGDVRFDIQFIVSLGKEGTKLGWNFSMVNAPRLFGSESGLVEFPSWHWQKKAFVDGVIEKVKGSIRWFDLFKTPDLCFRQFRRGAFSEKQGDDDDYWTQRESAVGIKEIVWVSMGKDSPSGVWCERYLKGLMKRKMS